MSNAVVIDREQFPKLFEALRTEGYTIVGPTVRENAIMFDELSSVDDLPVGKTDMQSPGSYTLEDRKDAALFGFTVGPQSPKKFLFPMRLKMFGAKKEGRGFRVSPGPNYDLKNIPAIAFFGMKSCELSAVGIQDKVFTEGPFTDAVYRAIRERAFIVAVNCTSPGMHCFCASMGTGPKAGKGYDLALTEIVNSTEHYFVVEAGSAKGSAILASVPNRPAEAAQEKGAQQAVDKAAHSMGKSIKTDDVKNLLLGNLEHPEYDSVAARCMTCANCTLVCPTCFCMTVEDSTDLTGETTERWRRWNSCFTMDFTKVAGGNFRTSAKSRYRQWLTHKLAGWHEQFGTSGCVGCGRCITWCPVGIDILAEVDAIRGDGSPR